MLSLANICCLPTCDEKDSALVHFPCTVKRQKEWLRRLDVPELKNLTPATLARNRRICIIHFESKYVIDRKGSPAITRNAIPSLRLKPRKITRINESPATSPATTPGKAPNPIKKTLSQVTQGESKVFKKPRLKEAGSDTLRSNVQVQKQKSDRERLMKRNREKVFRLRRKIAKLEDAPASLPKVLNFLESRLPKFVFILVRSILLKRGSYWGNDERSLAGAIYFRSPKFLNFLRTDLGFKLPSISAIKYWLDNSRANEGLSNYVGNFLKEKCLGSFKKYPDCDSEVSESLSISPTTITSVEHTHDHTYSGPGPSLASSQNQSEVLGPVSPK